MAQLNDKYLGPMEQLRARDVQTPNLAADPRVKWVPIQVLQS